MTEPATARPQDVGRPHARRRRPRGDALLDRYQSTMRGWLGKLLDELEGDEKAGLHGPIREYPSTAKATELWRLATLLAKELGAAIDPPRDNGTEPSTPRPRAARYE